LAGAAAGQTSPLDDAAIVIFGAAVWPGGRASPALARRVGYGLAAARARPGCPVFCSIICTDAYHLPRVAMMLALLGVRSEPGPIGAGRGGAQRGEWWRMSAREVLAYPYDLALVLLRRREILAHTNSMGETAGT